MSSQMPPQGPPYRPTIWSLGGQPTKGVDIPATAVFLVLFILGAIWHMTVFQINKKRGHKFIFSAVIFGFCMSRIVTTVIRIASISKPNNISLSIAAAVFVAAGVLLLFIINLLWAHRILRALHPTIGWHPMPSIILRVLYVLIAFTLAIVITATVQSFYTLRPRTKKIDRSLQLYGSTFLAIISILPIFVVIFALVMPRRTPLEKFGAGRFRNKIIILLTGTTLVSIGAWYRCGTTWRAPVPRTQPLPTYFSKAPFYIFNFGVEILTVYLYGLSRVDLRFHVPNGAKGPGSYSKSTTVGVTDEESGSRIDDEADRAVEK